MDNTLANLEKLKSESSALGKILVELTSLFNKDYLFEKVSIPFPNYRKDAVITDHKRGHAYALELLVEIEAMENEWKLVESYIRIYKISARKLREVLGMEAIADHFQYNTLEHMDQMKQWSAAQQQDIFRLTEIIKAQEQEEANDFVGFNSPSAQSRAKQSQLHQAASENYKIQQKAQKEWDDIQAEVKRRNLTAKQYRSILKDIINPPTF